MKSKKQSQITGKAVSGALNNLNGDYLVIKNSRIRSWQVFLFAGIFAGLILGGIAVIRTGAVARVETAPADTLVFSPSADAMVKSKKPKQSYGNRNSVAVFSRPGDQRDSLLKFVVSGINDREVTSATLQIFVKNGTDKGGDFYKMKNPWFDEGVTWDSAPEKENNPFFKQGRVNAGSWYSVEIPFIRGDGVYAIRIVGTSNDWGSYGSRESNNSPELRVTVVEGSDAPIAPTGLRVSASSNSAILTWDLGAEPNIVNYVNRYRPTGTSTWIFTDWISASETSSTVSGLGRETEYEFQVRAIDNNGNKSAFSESVITTTIVSVTSRIEAEAYKSGGEGIGYHDTDIGNNGGGTCRNDDVDTTGNGNCVIGWFSGTEWLAYDVDIAAEGSYELTARVARGSVEPSSFRLELDGASISGQIQVNPTNSWNTFTTITYPGINLMSGKHELRLVSDNYFNIDWMDFSGPGSITVDYNAEPATNMINGFMARNPDHLCDCSHDAYLGGGVVLVKWSDLEPQRGKYDWSSIDSSIAKYKVADIDAYRLRILGGINSPQWVKDSVGVATWYEQEFDLKNYQLPKMWNSNYILYWRELQEAAYNEYGPDTFAQVVVSGAGTVYAESYIRQIFIKENQATLEGWGVDRASDGALHLEALKATRDVWGNSLVLSMFSWQYMDNGKPRASLADAAGEIQGFIDAVPELVVMQNDLRSQPGSSRQERWDAMGAFGQAISFQTAPQKRIGDWEQAIQMGLDMGATSIELPVGYDSWDINRFIQFADAF